MSQRSDAEADQAVGDAARLLEPGEVAGLRHAARAAARERRRGLEGGLDRERAAEAVDDLHRAVVRRGAARQLAGSEQGQEVIEGLAVAGDGEPDVVRHRGSGCRVVEVAGPDQPKRLESVVLGACAGHRTLVELVGPRPHLLRYPGRQLLLEPLVAAVAHDPQRVDQQQAADPLGVLHREHCGQEPTPAVAEHDSVLEAEVVQHRDRVRDVLRHRERTLGRRRRQPALGVADPAPAVGLVAEQVEVVGHPRPAVQAEQGRAVAFERRWQIRGHGREPSPGRDQVS